MLDEFDLQAIQEGDAIRKSFKPRTIDIGKRLKCKYYSDGVPQLTGQRHRRAGAWRYGSKRVIAGHTERGIPIIEK